MVPWGLECDHMGLCDTSNWQTRILEDVMVSEAAVMSDSERSMLAPDATMMIFWPKCLNDLKSRLANQLNRQ